jgi:hypothetical protein
VIDIVALAEAYTKGKRGSTRKAAYEAFIAGAQALSVATRAEWEIGLDYVKPAVPIGRRKKLREGHQWFTA